MAIKFIKPYLAHKARPATPITLLVVHWTAGHTLQGAVAALRERGNSYHVLIDRDGQPWVGVPFSQVAFHAGNSYGPRELARGIPKEQDSRGEFVARTSVNPYSVGVSLVGGSAGKADFTHDQVEALDELIRTLLKPKLADLTHIAGHLDVSPRRKPDPGKFDVRGLAKRHGLSFFTMR